MTIESKTKDRELKSKIIFWCGNTILWFMLYWNVCVGSIDTDFYWHERYVSLLLERKMVLMHPGYHFLVAFFVILFGIEISMAAVIVLTIATCISIYLTRVIIKDSLDINFLSEIQLLVFSLLLNIVQPIFFYGYAPGYCSGNGYISPTQIVCKPFALAVMWQFLRMHKNKCIKLKDQLILLGMILLSSIMKPLFAMAFIPAAGSWYLIKVFEEYSNISKKCIIQYLKCVWPMIVCGIFLIVQYMYGIINNGKQEEVMAIGSDTHVRLGFLYAWSMVVKNIPLSIFMAYFFPIVLIMLLFYNKSKNCNELTTQRVISYIKEKKDYIVLCALYAGISLLYISFLYQDNGCEMHMNFRNAWIVTFNYVYIIALAILLYMYKEKGYKSLDVRIGTIAFGIHILFGIALIAKNFIV